MNEAILIVDDNVSNLKLAAYALGLAGYRILRAESAEEAQVLLKTVLPDLILMDLSLPGMDGLTLTRMLKAESRTQNIPVAAVTAAAMKGDEEKALAAGCDAYVTKPIDTRALAGHVAEWLRRRHDEGMS